MEEENLSGKEKKKVSTIFKKKEIWISGPRAKAAFAWA